MRKLQKQTRQRDAAGVQRYRVFHRSRSITAKEGKLLAQHFLLVPLNTNPESPFSRRILEFIGLVQRAQQLHRELDQEVRRAASAEGVIVTRTIRRLGLGWKRALRQLNKLAGRYWWRLDLGMLPGNSEFLNTHIPITRSMRTAREAGALLLLTEFHDLAERIHRCDECAKWFFAATYHQTYCSNLCRQTHASHSAQFKAKRREYMQQTYRPLIKERKQKAKQQRIKELKQKITTTTQKIARLKGRQEDGGS